MNRQPNEYIRSGLFIYSFICRQIDRLTFQPTHRRAESGTDGRAGRRQTNRRLAVGQIGTTDIHKFKRKDRQQIGRQTGREADR